MTPKEMIQEKRRRIEQAMFPLVGDTRFQAFMEVVREQRDVAVQDAVSDRVVASERLLNVALGEIRCYESLLSIYESYRQQNAVDEAAEQ